MTSVHSRDQQLHRRLNQDSIQLAGKTIYINPFLYWRRLDTNTDRWLREPGQLGEDQIKNNRSRFYPELDWSYLDEDEQSVKDGSVEMFLKSLELISTFHPDLTASHLLEVERKMAVTKKKSFEKWVEKSFRRRFRQETKEQRRFERERFWRSLKEWLNHETTHQVAAPIVSLVILAGFLGWSLGVSNVTCSSLVSSTDQSILR